MSFSKLRILENKIPPPIVYILMGIVGWCIALNDMSVIEVKGTQTIISFVLVCTGLAVDCTAIYYFRKALTTVNPLKPASASSLIVKGVFKYSRNPMYLGMLIQLVGVLCYFGSVLSFITVIITVIYITHFQIIPEERAMQTLFGNEYSKYQAQVRRWI